ncbi:MAG: hypothetical protein ACT4OK_04000 [Gemmobacter sp.]
MRRRTVLEHDLAEGAMAPWFGGLRAGRAVASRCAICGRVACPPQRCCDCGGAVTDVTLKGRATVEVRTTGADGDVALVRMDGADTRTLALLDGFGGQVRGMVRASPDGVLILVPEGKP